MIQIGDIVRTKDVVGILDGENRGPGHPHYYQVMNIDKHGFILEDGSGRRTGGWDERQLEVSNVGAYLNEMMKEAAHHVEWNTERFKRELEIVSPDSMVNLTVLDILETKIRNAVQEKFDYEDIAEGLFEQRAHELIALDAPEVERAADTIAIDFDPRRATEESADIWAQLAGTSPDISDAATLTFAYPTVDATAGIPLEDLQKIEANFLQFEGDPQPMTEEQQAQFLSIFSPSMQEYLADGMDFSAVREAQQKASESLTRAQDAVDRVLPKVYGETDEIPLTELAELTGKKPEHLSKMISRNQLPKGRKVGRVRWMPAKQCLEILLAKSEPYTHWPKSDDKNVQAAPAVTETPFNWEALIS